MFFKANFYFTRWLIPIREEATPLFRVSTSSSNGRERDFHGRKNQTTVSHFFIIPVTFFEPKTFRKITTTIIKLIQVQVSSTK